MTTFNPPPPPKDALGRSMARDEGEPEHFRVYISVIGGGPSKKENYDDLDAARARRDAARAADPKFTTSWIVSTKTWEILE